jgi:hypothetical protein
MAQNITTVTIDHFFNESTVWDPVCINLAQSLSSTIEIPKRALKALLLELLQVRSAVRNPSLLRLYLEIF